MINELELIFGGKGEVEISLRKNDMRATSNRNTNTKKARPSQPGVSASPIEAPPKRLPFLRGAEARGWSGDMDE
jgi:hypothetical protein